MFLHHVSNLPKWKTVQFARSLQIITPEAEEYAYVMLLFFVCLFLSSVPVWLSTYVFLLVGFIVFISGSQGVWGLRNSQAKVSKGFVLLLVCFFN